MTNVDNLLNDSQFQNKLTLANNEIIDALSHILHGEKGHYKSLYKLPHMDVVREYNLINMPYFYKIDSGKYISKFRMSSGECMLISLLNFIISKFYTTRRNKKRNYFSDRKFIFIDEVELALHPSSIDRLIEYLENLTLKENMVVLFSTHSSELIRRMLPRNIFYLKNKNGNASIISPCYPQYAIRCLYDHDGYDCTILVEDKMSEIIIKKLISNFKTQNNLLVNVMPGGSWGNTLALQKHIMEQNAFGRDKFVFSIIDGDVESEVNNKIEYKNCKKLFLPIKSLEKYLYEKLLHSEDQKFIKFLGNKYFTLDSIDSVLKEAINNTAIKDDVSGKKLLSHMVRYLAKVNLNEEQFVKDFGEDLFMYEKFDKLQQNIEKFINNSFYIKQKNSMHVV